MNNWPKVLVAITNYNHERFLEKSISSIQNQSYQNLDICIYDDGSKNKEKIREIVNRLSKEDDRIRFIDSEKNVGKWFGLNESIRTTDSLICTSHDADDISAKFRIERQLKVLFHTKTIHNLCGFESIWKEEDIKKIESDSLLLNEDSLSYIDSEKVYNWAMAGFSHPLINHYYTGEFETAGASAIFYKRIWDTGLRFNPPNLGLRAIMSEDSDFNFRATAFFKSTSILSEKQYLYRRETSTNKEEM